MWDLLEEYSVRRLPHRPKYHIPLTNKSLFRPLYSHDYSKFVSYPLFALLIHFHVQATFSKKLHLQGEKNNRSTQGYPVAVIDADRLEIYSRTTAAQISLFRSFSATKGGVHESKAQASWIERERGEGYC